MFCMTLQEMQTRLEGLVVFRALRQNDAVQYLRMALHLLNTGAGAAQLVPAIADFEQSLLPHGGCWTKALQKAILEDENICIRKAASGGAGAMAEACLKSELAFLQELGQLTLSGLLADAPAEVRAACAFLPAWEVCPADYPAAYAKRLSEVGQKGYGMFAQYHVFTVEDGVLTPVRCPDPQRLRDLPGYEAERRKVVENTEALLAGRPANNVLLYGDAGTGKSSTVKALANEYAPQGLRLVEVKKNQLYQIPAVMDTLAENPLKFILFIDDLSFTANDDDFAALKAILEGSAGGRSHNVAVYATSNRRHLVKETLTDRSGDDIHEMDTRQELMSLSARFGLTVTFQRPDKVRYQAILVELARQYGVRVPEDQLVVRGEAFALRAGGRSPRVARQFIELLAAGVHV